MSGVIAVVCGFDKSWSVSACQRCGLPMLETELGFCSDCLEWLRVTPTRDGGRGKRRGSKWDPDRG